MSYDPNQPPQQPYAGPPAKPVNPKLVFWTSSKGVLILVGGTIALIVIIGAGIQGFNAGATRKSFDTRVTGCDATTSSNMVTIGFTVKNTGNRTATAKVLIEYRDGAGSRLDTDTSYLRDIAPGDTARGQESTVIDAVPDGGMRCKIVGVS